jgi:serine/threonine protein kinase
MAVVYLGRQLDLDRWVALKELALLVPGDPGLAARFLREARLAGSLSHPNIVTVHEYLEERGVPYIAMEYIERGSLRHYINRMTLPQVAGVLEGVLAGLDYANKRQIVHRDIKPENVMIDGEGRVKIADFGIAKATNAVRGAAALTSAGVAVGTPNYMAPEQATARAVGPSTDLYAVGIMAFEMLVGWPPFADVDDPLQVLMRQVDEPVPRVESFRPDVDGGVSAWIERLTQKDPGLRPASAAEAWDEIEERLLTLLGPRWRRDASLVAVGEASRTSRPTRRLHRSGRQTPAGGRGATTVPPRAAPVASTSATKRRNGGPRRHFATIGLRSLAVLVLGAAVALGAQRVGSGGSAQPTTTQPPTVSTASGAKSNGTAADDPLALSSVTGAAASDQQLSLARATLKKQRPIALRLARKYERAADNVAALPADGAEPAGRLALAAALRAVSSAYRDAAAAAGAGDATAYAAALTRIDSSKQLARQAVADLKGSSGSGTSDPSGGGDQAASAGGGCAGDSSSDDPSDDSCGSEP